MNGPVAQLHHPKRGHIPGLADRPNPRRLLGCVPQRSTGWPILEGPIISLVLQCPTLPPPPLVQAPGRSGKRRSHRVLVLGQSGASARRAVPKDRVSPKTCPYSQMMIELCWCGICRLWGRFRTARAQRGHSANYCGDYPGDNPANHPPAESCAINSKLKNSNI